MTAKTLWFCCGQRKKISGRSIPPRGLNGDLGFGRDRQSRETVLLPDPRETFRIRTRLIPDGWEAEYRIPGEFLRRCYPEFRFTGILKANVYKCGDKTVHPHYLAWNPVDSSVPDYHRPESFGTMILE